MGLFSKRVKAPDAPLVRSALAGVLMYDSTDPASPPAGAQALAGYCDGIYPNVYQGMVDRFPNLHAQGRIVSIASRFSTVARIMDYEPGNPCCSAVDGGGAVPSDYPRLVAWVKQMISLGVYRPGVYADGRYMGGIAQAFAESGLARNQYVLWFADPTRERHLPIGYDSCQFDWWGPNPSDGNVAGCDISWCTAEFFPGSPAPTKGPKPLPTIKEGDSGVDVVVIQLLLGVAPNGGYYGPETTAAVKAAQTAHKLTVDGIVGSQTWGALLTVVQTGSRGGAVKGVQMLLDAYGYGLTVDGQFGPATAAAVTSFQTKHDLTADGAVGSVTWSWLLFGGFKPGPAPKPVPKPPTPGKPAGQASFSGSFDQSTGTWKIVGTTGTAKFGSVDQWASAEIQLDQKTGAWRIAPLPLNAAPLGGKS